MHASRTRTCPNQSPKANNRAARKRAEHQRQRREYGLDIVQARGISATAGSRGANKRRNGK
jgi:hypothetical protein